MSRPEKAYARASHSQRIYSLALVAGETRNVGIDWNQYLGELDTTISSSCFSSDGGTIGIADQAIADGVTTVSVSAANSGNALLENCVTFVNGEILVRHWYIRVSDPSISLAAMSDYRE